MVGGDEELGDAFGSSSYETLDKIESYWDKLRRGRLVPQRFEVDPRGLAGALSHAFVLERVSEGSARFRISGFHLTDIAGTELRGVPISAIFTANAREELAEVIAAVFDDPSIVRLKIASPHALGKPPIKGCMLLLPLRSDVGEITRILGGIEMVSGFGVRPRKLEIVSQSRRGLTGYAREKAARSHQTPSNRPNLRLVVCNR